MDRSRLIAEKNAEIDVLTGLNLTEVTPSRRDFAMFVATQKNGITLVPRLKRADPDTGKTWPGLDVVALARTLDDTEVGALAVATAGYYGASIGDLLSVTENVTAPILRDDLCLHRLQVFQARLHGADAVVVPVQYTRGPMAELVQVANSTHMAAVIEVTEMNDVDAALAFPTACIGIHAQANGRADLERVRAIAQRIPHRRTVLLLTEVSTLDELDSLNGVVDAAVVGEPILDAADPSALIRDWQQRQDDSDR
jgi:indole-3-glycerol phosphate synthase